MLTINDVIFPPKSHRGLSDDAVRDIRAAHSKLWTAADTLQQAIAAFNATVPPVRQIDKNAFHNFMLDELPLADHVEAWIEENR